ncbi:MAG: tRNA dihydrouridine synthase DusB [Bdellovibrionales bacterium]|nr:tRNA dihydrouridine synthase DusB [Bdellovibrionales bacterium]
MKIGNVPLFGPCRLAPMAGVSNTPFRLVCKEMGSSLTTSEEISAKALVHGNDRTSAMAGYLPEEKPIALQLFGGEPEVLAEAARILESRGADIIDLNMGCPVPKVTKTGAGSALMRDPLAAARVLRAIRAAIRVPFTIKIRGGWDDTTVNAPEISRIAEAEGVDAIAVHPRTRSQQYTGHAPWEIIRMVVESVKIPVTGNGDVKSFPDAERMMRETGCHSVMIGRGALGKPWVFSPEFSSLTLHEQHDFKFRVIRRHLDLIGAHMPERFALVQAKKHLAWYTVGTKGGNAARARIFHFEDMRSLRAFFEDYWPQSIRCPGLSSPDDERPPLHE